MNGKGWILLSRKLLEWQWFDKSEMVHLWIYLLLSANIEEKKWHGITIKRGQFVTSLKKLEQATKLSIQCIRTCLKRLLDTDKINIQTTKQYSLITICNYCSYQNFTQPQKLTTNTQTTIEQQTTNTQTTIEQQQLNNITINNKQISREGKIKNFSEHSTETTQKNLFGEDNTTPTLIPETGEEKEKIAQKRKRTFTPPTVAEVQEEINAKGYHVDAHQFCNFYESKNWYIGKNKMQKWKAALATWERRWKEEHTDNKNHINNGNYNNRQKQTNRNAGIEPANDIQPDEF